MRPFLEIGTRKTLTTLTGIKSVWIGGHIATCQDMWEQVAIAGCGQV